MAEPKEDLSESNILMMPKRYSNMSDAVREAFGIDAQPKKRAEDAHFRPRIRSQERQDDVVEEVDVQLETVETVAPRARAKKEPATDAIQYLSLEEIHGSPFQTREIHSDKELNELVQSIESKGVLQPVIVRKLASGEYELVAGERRWRASQLAGVATIPAIVRELDDREALEFSIIENAQREDLNPVEEALAYKKLADSFRLTQTEIASVIGKNRSTITNALRLLQLHPDVLAMIKAGELSAGHGRALLGIENLKLQLRVAKRVIQRELSVRDLEHLVVRLTEKKRKRRVTEEMLRERKNLQRQGERLKESLGVEKLSVSLDPKGSRRISITFEDDASWRKFLTRVRD